MNKLPQKICVSAAAYAMQLWNRPIEDVLLIVEANNAALRLDKENLYRYYERLNIDAMKGFDKQGFIESLYEDTFLVDRLTIILGRQDN